MPRGIPLKKRVAKKTAAAKKMIHLKPKASPLSTGNKLDYEQEYNRLLVEHKMLHEYRMKQDRRIDELENKLVIFTDRETDQSYRAQPANNIQIGGDHYRRCKIQPWDFISANGLGFMEGTVISYLTRWEDKGGIQDLRKCQHYLDKMIELETERRRIRNNLAEAQQAANETIGGVLNSLSKSGIGRGS